MPLFVILIVALIVVLLVVLIPRYQRDKREAIQRFRAIGKILQTANGPVEYAVRGDGFPMLIWHGTGGGCEQALLVGRLLDPERYKVIAVTRSGYRGTPLSSGPSFEQQADAAIAVLDALNIKRVGVMAISGGGPAAIQFGLRHADRCVAIVLVSAHGPGTAHTYSARTYDSVSRIVKIALSVDFPMWCSLGVPIRWSMSMLGDRPEILRDPKHLEIAQAILHDTFPPSDYYDGAVNDLDQVANLRNPPEWPLGDLKVPTLILHGTNDILVRFEAAKYHAEHIPGAKLIAYEGGSHFAASTHEQEMRQAVAEFMANVLQVVVR